MLPFTGKLSFITYFKQLFFHEKIQIFFSFLFFSSGLNAQCSISHLNASIGIGNVNPGNTQGQTFIPCQTGVITQITFETHANTSAGTGHELRIGASPVVPTDRLGGSALETFSTAGGAETIIINLTTPFSITAGQTYAFDYTVGSSIIATPGCSPCNYADGNRYFSSSPGSMFNMTSFDMNFTMQIGAAVAAAVPTLGEWGLILLSLLLLTFGMVALHSREVSLAGAGTTSSSFPTKLHQWPFDKAAFGKMLVLVMLGLAVVFSLAVSAFGYEMTDADVPGSLVAGPVLAYLLHLVFHKK